MEQLHAFLHPSGGFEGPAMPVTEPPAQLCTQLQGRAPWLCRVDVVEGGPLEMPAQPQGGSSLLRRICSSQGWRSHSSTCGSAGPRSQHSRAHRYHVCPCGSISLQASHRGLTVQVKNSPECSGDALHAGWPWGSLWVRGQKEEGLGSYPIKGRARGFCSSLSLVSVPMPRTRRHRGSQKLAGGPSGGKSQSPRWVPR